MKRDAATIADNAFTLAMQDGSWRGLGFQRRPPRSWHTQVLKPKWRRDYEHRAQVELLVLFAAAQIAGLGVERISVLYEVVEVFFGGEEDAFSRLIFQTREACVDALQSYVTRPAGEWLGILAKRLALDEIADKRMRRAVVVKSAFFMQVIETVRLQTSMHGTALSDWPKARSFDELVDGVYAATPARASTGLA